MKSTTISFRDDQYEEIEARTGDNESKSEVVRRLIDQAFEAEELQKEVDRLQRERRQLLEQREENKELVRYVEGEQQWREASLTTRLRWWIKGMD